jgi:hypothetical protein
MTRKSPPRQLLLIPLLLAAVLVPAAGAGAASISYLGPDGNVWVASPDGKVKKRLTSDAAPPDVRYRSPTQQDNGTVVATRGNSTTAFAVFLRPSDGKQVQSWILPKEGSGSFAPFSGGQIHPGGGLYIYDWRYFNLFPGPTGEQRVSVIAGPGASVTPCTLPCHTGFVRPRWIPGTPYAGFITDNLRQIHVQSAGGVTGWLGLADPNELIHSFDVSSTGLSLVETALETATSSGFYLLANNGVPPAGTVSELCRAEGLAPNGSDPRWSPDATQIAWEGQGGIYVSPAPVDQGTTCGLSPKLVIPGGTDASWGRANVQGCPPNGKAAASKKKKGKKRKKKGCAKKKRKKKGKRKRK